MAGDLALVMMGLLNSRIAAIVDRNGPGGKRFSNAAAAAAAVGPPISPRQPAGRVM
jgi:hypothetical protein